MIFRAPQKFAALLFASWLPRFVILSERSESKDLRTYHYICTQIGAKILRLRALPFAQDDRFGSWFVFAGTFLIIRPSIVAKSPRFVMNRGHLSHRGAALILA